MSDKESIRERLIARGTSAAHQPAEFEGNTYWFLRLRANQVEAWQDWLGEQDKAAVKYSYRARLIVESLCDENGKRVFDQPTDVAVLSELSNDLIEWLWMTCRKVNGMDKKAVEDAEKN